MLRLGLTLRLALFEPCPIIGLYPVDLEGVLVFGELFEITGGEFAGDVLFLGGIDEGDAGSLEAGTGETATIDTGQGAHDVVDGDEFRTATLVIMDAGLTTVKTKFAEEFEITRFPGGDTLTYTAVFRIEMFGPAGKTLWHGDARLVESGLGDVAEESLIERLQRLVGIGQHIPGRRLTLKDAQVIVAVDQRTGEAAEEDTNLEGRHVGITANDAVVVGVTVEEEQSVLLSEGDTSLIEDTVVEADIFPFGLRGNLDDLHRFEGDIVCLGKSHHISNEDSRRTGESADGQRSLDDTLDTPSEFEAFAQCKLGTAGIVAPVVFANLRRAGDVELDIPFESAGREFDDTVLADIEPEVNTFVDGKARDQTVLMIDVGAERADTVGGVDVMAERPTPTHSRALLAYP